MIREARSRRQTERKPAALSRIIRQIRVKAEDGSQVISSASSVVKKRVSVTPGLSKSPWSRIRT